MERMGRTLQRIRGVLGQRLHHDIWEVGQWLGQVVNGWLNYYAVPGSSQWLQTFAHQVRTVDGGLAPSLAAASLPERMTELLWPPIRIRHPWPDRRFAVNYLR